MSSEILKTVYLVRHGQSVDNVSPVFQSANSPLSERGQEQADHIAERLAHLSFETLISSPFPRAKETAASISQKTGKEPIYSDLFIERIKPTSIDGEPFENTEAAQTWRNWQDTLYADNGRVEDSENFDDIVSRTDRALTFLEDRPEASSVVVTHGFFLRVLIARVLIGDKLTGPIMKRFQASAEVENTGITVLRYLKDFDHKSPHWQLWTFNDHSHFAE